MARVEIIECHEDHIILFYSDGMIEEKLYGYEGGMRVVDLDQNNEIFKVDR